ncbi:MAG TPA: polyprenyl synthetase family protein [Candidatus Krumholzibacteria bacterium]|nr:polyprenyl synthetase family protein [Candidatus Krumholzibacteria bacterium]HPD71264.1 polyprenyl synthetase family protein [Candidatus Krumholzibacteria bacterium]HRY39036.1 polyprenyl synthetase family protein [Candidatus Krumholzibacteria bacterium]
MSLPEFEHIKLARLQSRVRPHLDAMQAALDRLTASDIALADEVGGHVRRGQGKLFRPTLLFLSAMNDGGVPAAAIEAAAAVELVHTATLVHDDFIDDAKTRRGLPTVNARYGPSTALIMGDLLYTRALQHLARLNLALPLQLMTDAAVLMSEAEIIQVQTRYRLDVDEETYLRIIYQKTASLIECACRIGASFLPDGAAVDGVFEQFGRQTGLVFQITDDIFDYLGDPRRLGKPTGRDWEEGRVTLPLIAAWREAGEADRRDLAALAGSRDPAARAASWPRVQAFVEAHRGVEYAYDRARRYGDEAKRALADLPDGPRRDLLRTAVEYVINRLN